MTASLAPLFADYPPWFAAVSALVVAAALAYLLAELVSRGTCRTLGTMLSQDDHGRAAVQRVGRLVRWVVFALLLLVLAFPALELVGLSMAVGLRPEVLARWFLASGLRIGVVVLVGFLIVRIVSTVTVRFEQQVGGSGSIETMERLRRARTLGTLIRNTVGTIVAVIATLMILRELNLDITPILTGAGIVGLAVGFGAQSLVKDIISGFFLILENQVRVGDVAAINGTGGQVEAISLRTIVLRDGNGTVHVFPNGSITTLSNQTKDFSYYPLDLNVAYDEDTDRVIALLREVARDLQADPAFAPVILAPIEVNGIDAFGDAQLTIKSRIKTLPIKQWDVGRELRRRLIKRLNGEGIKLARPSTTLLLLDAQTGAAVAPKTPEPGQPA